MGIVLHYHPFSRAANVVWMLEEIGVPYELRFVDLMGGAHKQPEILKLNPMGKLPILEDGDALVTESAAIAIYLGDRYSSGNLAPKLDDPKRGTYLRWSFFSPSVVEPGLMAKAAKWEFRASAAGWGNYDDMIAAMTFAIAGRDYILGSQFSMADCVFGGLITFMLQFKMLEATPVFTAYSERCKSRPANQRAQEINGRVIEERGLKMPGG